MTYPYFFVKKENIFDDKIKIIGEDLNHMANVLRVKEGDFAEISDNSRYRYKSRVLKITGFEAILKVEERIEIKRKIPEFVLFQCLIKKSAMEMVIQKTTEIGIDKIIPVFSKRVVVDKRKIENKINRWNKIAEESSKQCKRDFIPEVLSPISIQGIDISEYQFFYLPYERSSISFGKVENLKELKNSNKIGYIVGPEGGFEEEEIKFLEGEGAKAVSLGKNVLRSETSAIYFLSILDFLINQL